MRSRFIQIETATAAGLFAVQDAMACTRVLWSAPDGQVFVGRTQDWTEKANSAFRVYPRGIERTGAVAENPHKWTSKYGSVALSAYDAFQIEPLILPNGYPTHVHVSLSDKSGDSGRVHRR